MMKKLFLTSLVGLLLSCSATFAQGYKIAYANVEFILAKMPEMKSIQNQLQVEQQQLQKMLMKKGQEFEQKVAEFEKAAQIMNPVARADKQRELQDLQGRLKKMEQDAQSQLMNQEHQLSAPLFQKIETAISAVAKAKGFQYVLNSQTLSSRDNIVLYAQNESDNITVAVLAKLGVTVSPSEIK